MTRSTLGRVISALVLALPLQLPAQLADPASAPLTAVLPSDAAVRTGVLPNGMRYFVRANARPEKRAELRLAVNAGSILEDDDQHGLAHFVEHMAFNGTANFSKSAIVDFLEYSGMRFGADVNAYTSFDETVYMLQLPTDSAGILQKGLQVLQEWAHAVSFDSVEVEKERGVVIEEWRSGRGAQSRVQDKQFPILLSGSRYAERIPIGSQESLQSFPQEALRRFYRDWYRPELMSVVAVGDFDAAEMERQIRERFSVIPRSASARERIAASVPSHDSAMVSVETDPELTGTAVSVYFKQPVRVLRTFADYRRQIVESLFNQMLNMRLYEMTVKPDAPFVSGYSGQGRLVRQGETYLLSATVKDGGVSDGLRALLLEAERVARFGFTDGELERAKADMLRGMELAFNERDKTNSAVFAGEYVRAFLEEEPYPGVGYEFELYKRFIPGIEVADVNALAREWVSDRNRVILASGPAQSTQPMPDGAALLGLFGEARAAQLEAYVDETSEEPLLANRPAPGTVTAERSIPEIGVTEWTLSNGARVVLKPTDYKADEVHFAGFSPGGYSLASDSDAFVMENAGIAIGVGGVGAFNQVELERKLAGKAASAGTYISELEEGVSGGAAPSDLETMFELMYLYFTQPRRDSSAYEAFRQQARAMLQFASADPGQAFSDTLERVMANYSPRVRTISVALLDSLDLDRSIAFYRDRFSDASDFTFVLVGTFDLQTVRPLVETYIGGLPSTGRTEKWRDTGVRPPAGVVRKVVRRGLEPKAQTAIQFTGEMEFTRANRFALSALSEVLNIRLREILREDMGGTYGVNVSAGAQRDPYGGYQFAVSFGAAPENVDSLSAAVFAEIDAIKRDGPREQDLEKVRETLRRTRESNMRLNGFWVGQLSAYYRLGEDPRMILSYDELLGTLTANMVQDAARRFLNVDRYVQVTLLPER